MGHAAKGAIETIGVGALAAGAAVAGAYVFYVVLRRRRRLAAGGPQRQGQSREHERE